MSWVERIKSGIQITTGDGKVYTPLYMITSRTVNYNVAEFEFPNIEGTLVKRSEPKGRRFNFELIFQGDDHLDVADQFETSAKDKRPWKVFHPIHGNLILQQTSLEFDATGLNHTMVKGSFIETITDDAPKVTIDPKDKSTTDAAIVAQKTVAAFADRVDPTPQDVTKMGNDISDMYNTAVDAIKSQVENNEYFNFFNRASGAILNAASDAEFAATAINDFIVYPFLFSSSVRNRLKTLGDQYKKLGESIVELLTPNQKAIYQLNAGSIFSSMVQTAINPADGDYQNITEVLDTVELITSTYDDFLTNLDILQTDTSGEPDSFIPEFDSISSLTDLVNFAVSQLFVIATEAQVERVVILEKDSNPIELAHRFYGLQKNDGDANLDRFILENEIGLNEHLQIKKGRRLVYYI